MLRPHVFSRLNLWNVNPALKRLLSVIVAVCMPPALTIVPAIAAQKQASLALALPQFLARPQQSFGAWATPTDFSRSGALSHAPIYSIAMESYPQDSEGYAPDEAPDAQDYAPYPPAEAPYPQGQTQQYAPQYREQLAPLASYVCLLHYRDGSCPIAGPIGIVSGAACHCRFAGRVQYGAISLAPPHFYTCLVADGGDSCQVPGPAGVASGTNCFCELPGKVE